MTAQCLNNKVLNPNSLMSYELNNDNAELNINNTDTDLAIEIDEDITEKILVQDIFMGR